MLIEDLFLDPAIRLITRVDGDPPPPPGGGDGGGDPPKPPTPEDKAAADKAAADVAAAAAAAGGAPGEWSQKALEQQVNRQHRKLKEQDTEILRLKAIEDENKRLRELVEAAASRRADGERGGDPPSPPPPPAPRREVEPPPADQNAVMAAARFEVRVEELNKRLTGDDTYRESWKVGWDNLQRAAQGDKAVIQSIVADALNTDDPAYVINELCKDPSKLQDTIDMPSGQRLAAMIKIGLAKDAAPPKPGEPLRRPSGAPPPPVGDHQRGGADAPRGNNLYSEKYEFKNYFQGNNVAPDAEKAADAEWFAERERQKRESTGRPWSVGGKAGARA